MLATLGQELLQHGRMSEESWSNINGLIKRLPDEELRQLIELVARSSDHWRPPQPLRPERTN